MFQTNLHKVGLNYETIETRGNNPIFEKNYTFSLLSYCHENLTK